jgi:hypothetical protein
MNSIFMRASVVDGLSSTLLAFPFAQAPLLAQPGVRPGQAVSAWIGEVKGLSDGLSHERPFWLSNFSKSQRILPAQQCPVYRNAQLRVHLNTLERALAEAGQQTAAQEARKLLYNGQKLPFSEDTPFARVSTFLNELGRSSAAFEALTASPEALAELGLFFRQTIAKLLFDASAAPSARLVKSQLEKLQQGKMGSLSNPFSRAVDVDYGNIFGNHRIVYVEGPMGSHHIQQEVTDELIPALRQRGFTHMALSVFHPGGPLEEYLRGDWRVGEQDLLSWECSCHNADPKAACCSTDDIEPFYKPFLEIARQAFAAGLAVVPLGLSVDEYTRNLFWEARADDVTSPQMRYDDIGWTSLQAQHLLGARHFLGELLGLYEMSRWIFEGAVPQKNFFAAEVLSRLLREEPAARIAVLAGRGQCGSWRDLRKSASINALVARAVGVRGPVVHFASPDRAVPTKPKSGFDSAEIVARLALASGRSSREMLEVKRDTVLSAAHHSSDWIVSLP